ncbi:MAG: C39 family peptidase [Caldilineaceae bacterium]|nr:C39 family peptidase [Caldilineaceae bacterium]
MTKFPVVPLVLYLLFMALALIAGIGVWRWQQAPVVAAMPAVSDAPGAIEQPAVTITARLVPSPPSTPLPTASPLPTVTPTPTATPPPAPQGLPATWQLAGLRHEWQTWNNCGPATLATYLSYYGSSLDQAAIGAVLRRSADDKNVSPEELATYAAAQGYMAQVLVNGDETLLRNLLTAGIPVLVETWHEAEPNDGLGHYRLLVGYDDAAQHWMAYDSYDRTGLIEGDEYQGIRLGYDRFAPWWQVFNRTFVLVYPPERAATVDALLAASGAAPATMWAAAAARAQAELALEPGNAFAWFNLGSSLTAQGDYGGAVQAFDQARAIGLPWRMLWYQFRPFEAYLAQGRVQDVLDLTNSVLAQTSSIEEIHYWRGRALAVTGDLAAARASLAQALTLNPDFVPAREALLEFGG